MNLSQNLVTTRKEHRCWGCGKTYPSGSKLWSVAGIHEGDFFHCYWCEICTAVLDGLEYWQKEDGFDIGEVLEFYKEEYEEAAQKIKESTAHLITQAMRQPEEPASACA